MFNGKYEPLRELRDRGESATTPKLGLLVVTVFLCVWLSALIQLKILIAELSAEYQSAWKAYIYLYIYVLVYKKYLWKVGLL